MQAIKKIFNSEIDNSACLLQQYRSPVYAKRQHVLQLMMTLVLHFIKCVLSIEHIDGKVMCALIRRIKRPSGAGTRGFEQNLIIQWSDHRLFLRFPRSCFFF